MTTAPSIRPNTNPNFLRRIIRTSLSAKWTSSVVHSGARANALNKIPAAVPCQFAKVKVGVAFSRRRLNPSLREGQGVILKKTSTRQRRRQRLGNNEIPIPFFKLDRDRWRELSPFCNRLEQVGSAAVAPTRQMFPHMQARVLHARKSLAAFAMKPTTILHLRAYDLSAAFGAGVSIAFLSCFVLSVIDRQMFANDIDPPRTRSALMLPALHKSESHRIFFQRRLWTG